MFRHTHVVCIDGVHPLSRSPGTSFGSTAAPSGTPPWNWGSPSYTMCERLFSLILLSTASRCCCVISRQER